MRRIQVAVLALLCLTFSIVSKCAVAQQVPTVTVMQSGSDELQRDLEFLMKLSGKDGEQQWPVVQSVLEAFLGGVDGKRPMRIDLILGGAPDTRLSIPVANQNAFLANVSGFVGAKERRIATGLYQFKTPTMQYFARMLPSQNPDWGIVVEDRANVPVNFQVLPAIQPLINAGFDLAATVENSKVGADDRRKVVLDLEKEVVATLQPLEGETDNEFAMRKLGLAHQFRELERIYADSQQLTLGWTTDQEKKEGRLDLELTALADSDLAKSIDQLATKPSRFAATQKTDDSIFFGRINHSLDAMRQKHLGEMFELMEQDANSRLDVSTDFTDEQKGGAKVAIEKGFAMLRAGTQMGVIDGFIDVNMKEGKKGVVGAIRVADGALLVDVLRGLKDAGWEVELGEAGKPAATAAEKSGEEKTDAVSDEKAGDDSVEKPGVESKGKAEEETTAVEKDGKADDAPADDKPAEPAVTDGVTYHSIVLPEKFSALITSLIGHPKFVVATSKDAVYYAAGEGADARLRAAVAATAAAPAGDNDGTFLEAWYRVGPIIGVAREERERREAGLDLSKLTPEQKTERKERQEMRERAEQAFATGFDTIHTKLQRKESKVVGQTVFAIDILKFVGMEIINVAKTKLQ
ncbi:hypothetical protein GC176_22240 [bacterium]|nr:hypothetical protein [bacterium]